MFVGLEATAPFANHCVPARPGLGPCVFLARLCQWVLQTA